MSRIFLSRELHTERFTRGRKFLSFQIAYTVRLGEVGTGGEGGGGLPEKCAVWKTSKTQKTSRGGLAPSRPLGQ